MSTYKEVDIWVMIDENEDFDVQMDESLLDDDGDLSGSCQVYHLRLNVPVPDTEILVKGDIARTPNGGTSLRLHNAYTLGGADGKG